MFLKSVGIALFIFLPNMTLIGNEAPTSGKCVNGLVEDFYPCSGIHLSATVDLHDKGIKSRSGSDIWGWRDQKTGKEYAIMGLSNKTSFVDVTDPSAPKIIGHLNSRVKGEVVWRDIKVFNNHAYIVSELYGHGMQVFDLTHMRGLDEDLHREFKSDRDYLEFGSAHNIVINEDSGYAYAVGSNTCMGGMHVVNIKNPTGPRFVTCIDRNVFEEESGHGNKDGEAYTHDAQCVIYKGPDKRYTGREICVCSNEDSINIVDTTDKSRPYQISVQYYKGTGYTHQGWFSEDQSHFFLGDELDESNHNAKTRTLYWDFSDLEKIKLKGQFNYDTYAIDHNLYVRGGLLYAANYDAGLRILDVKNVDKVREVAFFDVLPKSDRPIFAGAWSVYPYFKSKTILVSDMRGKLFILKQD